MYLIRDVATPPAEYGPPEQQLKGSIAIPAAVDGGGYEVR